MSVKTTYRCDVCRSDKSPSDLYGVRFSNLHDFKLGSPIDHEGVHICLRCTEQIAKDRLATSLGKRDEV
jgi:hypothetical protein